MRPVGAKVQALEQYPVPSTKEELMSFSVSLVIIGVFAETSQWWWRHSLIYLREGQNLSGPWFVSKHLNR